MPLSTGGRFPDRNDTRASARQTRRMAPPCVEGAVARYSADFLDLQDLAEEFGQAKAVTCFAGSELHYPDVAGCHVQLGAAVTDTHRHVEVVLALDIRCGEAAD